MKKIFIILIFSSIFLSSCVKMDSDLYIDNNLLVSWKTTADFTKANELAKSMSKTIINSWSTNSKKKMPCDNFKSSDNGLLKNSSCVNINKNTAEITYKWLSITDKIVKNNKWYKLDLKSFINSNNGSNTNSKASINMMKWMWLEMNYNLYFSGTIIEANIWKIDWNILKFNIYDTLDIKDPYVIFKLNRNKWKKDEIINNLQCNYIKWKKVYIITSTDNKINYSTSPVVIKYKKTLNSQMDNLIYEPEKNKFAFKGNDLNYADNIPGKTNWFIIKDWDIVNNKYKYWKNSVFAYSPNWNHFAYTILENSKYIVVKDWIKSDKKYDEINNLIYSPNWKKLAYSSKNEWKRYIINNWVKKDIYYDIWEYDSFYGINNLVYSFSWDELSYSYKWYIIKNWIQFKDRHSYIHKIKYINKSNSIIYLTSDTKITQSIPDKDWFVSVFNEDYSNLIINWVKSKNYPYIWNLTLSPDWKGIAYIATKDNWKSIIVKDSVESKEYDNVKNLIYSYDWKSFSFLWKENWYWYIIKDWKKINTKYKYIDSISYEQNSNNLKFITSERNWNWYLIKETCNQNNNSNTSNMINNSQDNILEKTKIKSQLFKQLILSKRHLNKTFQWRKNIKTIDLIVKKLSKLKLEKLMWKLKKIDTSLTKFRKYKDMLNYLEAKVWLELSK